MIPVKPIFILLLRTAIIQYSLFVISAPCSAGNYMTETGCQQCGENTFSEDGASSCTSCPEDMVSTTGSKSEEDCFFGKTKSD